MENLRKENREFYDYITTGLSANAKETSMILWPSIMAGSELISGWSDETKELHRRVRNRVVINLILLFAMLFMLCYIH